MTTKSIALDVWQIKNVCVKANQGEVNSRFLEITLTDKGVPIDLTGKTVIFYATKPDGNVIYNLCEIEDATHGLVSICLTSQMSIVAGKMPCEIHLINNNGATLKSIELEIEIVKCADVDGAVESTSEFTALQEAMSEFSISEIKIDGHIGDKNNPHEVSIAQIGAAASNHNHSASDITSGTLPIVRGGTGATNVSDAWANMQMYTSVGQLGLSYPCTAVEICNAMPNKSIFVTNIEDKQVTVTDIPVSWGLLNIIKISSARKKLEFARTLGTDCTRYIGGYSSSDTTVTWKYMPYGTILINQGGTGATTANGALTNLGAVPTSRTINSKSLAADVTLNASDVGAAESSHNHSASDITSGSLPVSMGGTGATTADNALTNLGAVPTTRTINSKALSSDVTLSASDVGAAIYEAKSNADFNDVQTPGLYTMRSSTTNAPTSGSYHSLIVNKSDTGNFVQQLAIKEGTTQMYIRYGSSSWGAWKKFALSEEVPTNEFGTWTPSIDYWEGGYNGTYTASNSYYYKIGRMVYVQCRVKFTSSVSGSHNVSLNGLPFMSSAYSVGDFNLNGEVEMQGHDFVSKLVSVGKTKNYITFDGFGAGEIDNNRYLTVSLTYITN